MSVFVLVYSAGGERITFLSEAGFIKPHSVIISHKQHSYFVAIYNNTLYGSNLYIFILCQKSLDIKIMFHEDILKISYNKYMNTKCLISNMHW